MFNEPRYTPAWLAADMVAEADVRPWHPALEPSAGRGDIARAIKARTNTLYCVELNAAAAAGLNRSGLHTLHADFLRFRPGVRYERIVMNPPRDAWPHVLHALDLLTPGGVLVALLRHDAPGVDGRYRFEHRYHPLDPDIFSGPAGEPVPSFILRVQR